METAAALRVLDSIEHAGTNDPAGILAGHIAADRIGMFGYSFGGAVAAQAATSDSRIRAAANLDGWIFADAAARGVPRPFLIIANGGDDSGNDASADSSTPYSRKLDATNLEQILDGLQRHGGFLLSISGVEHDSFSDFFFIPSIHRRDHGALDPQRTQTLIATYLVAFFDRYLNDRSGPLLEVSGTGSGHRIVKTIDPAARLDIWQVSRTSFAPVMPLAGSLGRAAGIGKTPLRPITSG